MQILDVFLGRLVGVAAFRCDFWILLVRSAFGTNPNAHLIGYPRVLSSLAAGRWGRFGATAVRLGIDKECARTTLSVSQPNCLL